MTRVKVKLAFASKSSAPPRSAHHQHHHGDPEDDEEPHDNAPYVYQRRKRASSSVAPYIHRPDSYSNSAHESSSSQDSSSSGSDKDDYDEYGYHKNASPPESQRAVHPLFARPRTVDSRIVNRLPPQRGGVLLKVKPPGDFRNEFHERSQGNGKADGGVNRGSWHSDAPHESFSSRDRSALPSHIRHSEESSFSSEHHHVSLQRRPEFQKRSESVAVEELNSALTVIRKIMKMDAAEPFNEPVDPYALGIPDYFDVVKNPMDLGTICKRLEKGGHYRNSQAVYEDVQLVWTNCRTYNQKGDPILDLMSRVKKNFMKYWTAAGLYTEKHQGQEADKGRVKIENVDKCVPKKEPDIHITPGKARRASGTGHHKADCSCVVCTGVRRKLAREGKLTDSPAGSGSGTTSKSLPRVKQEPNMDSDNGFTDRKEDAISNDLSGDEVEDGPTNKEELGKVESTPQPKRGRPLGSTKAMKLEREALEASGAEETDAEMEDMEMEVEEDGVRFYPVSYEMPLRKIQPAVLHMGQKLFGTNSTWNRSISVCRNRSQNPILETVSLLVSSKGAGC